MFQITPAHVRKLSTWAHYERAGRMCLVRLPVGILVMDEHTLAREAPHEPVLLWADELPAMCELLTGRNFTQCSRVVPWDNGSGTLRRLDEPTARLIAAELTERPQP